MRKPITQTGKTESKYTGYIIRHKPSNIKTRRKPVQHEAQIQTALFEWAEIMSPQYPELKLMFHIPNGGRRDTIEAHRLKRQGTKAGLPDICLPVARSDCHGLYIELKSEKGRLSDNQKTWLTELEMQGYETAVCYSYESARDKILSYLTGW